MKSLSIIILILATGYLSNAQINKRSNNNISTTTAPFTDPHLQFQNKQETKSAANSYQIDNSIAVFNKSYDTLFIIDKYGKHIFDLNIPKKKNELIEISTATWLNGSYEIIAIKNNEAYHQKIVKL